jgi:hypothetical protein
MDLSDSAGANKFNASAWLVWLALSSGLRKVLMSSLISNFRFVSSGGRKIQKGFAKSQFIGLWAHASCHEWHIHTHILHVLLARLGSLRSER